MQPPPRSVEYSKLKSCIKSWEQTTWSASCLGYAIYFIWREFLFLLVQRHLAMNANVKGISGIPGNPPFQGYQLTWIWNRRVERPRMWNMCFFHVVSLIYEP